MAATSAVRRACSNARRRVASIRSWRDTELGQSLVEFSLVLPIFLLLLFALVDFGRAYYSWLQVTNAAREGARAAAVQSDVTTVQNKIYASLCNSYPSNCSVDTSKMTITPSNIQGKRGDEATIDISYTFSFVTPIGGMLKLVGGNSISAPTIKAHSSMRLE
jgi:Flp pilus assembly protein TadG